MTTNKYCFRCLTEVEEEHELDYPYVCPHCDENLYEFEVLSCLRDTMNITHNSADNIWLVETNDGNNFSIEKHDDDEYGYVVYWLVDEVGEIGATHSLETAINLIKTWF